MTGPHFGMVPRRVARLLLSRRDHAVLDVIACHASKEGRAWPSRETIAREAGIDKSKVSFCVRRLEEKGVLEVARGGGRGRANHYRIIPDEEALRCASQPATQADIIMGAALNGAISGTETVTEKGAVSGSKTVPILALNGAISGTPTEIEQNLEQSLPYGEGRARTREEEGFSQIDQVDGRQRELLLPINGGGSVRLKALSNFNPSAALVKFASDLRVNALDPNVLGRFIDWHLAHGKVPVDVDAAYRIWIRNEAARFSGGRTSQRSPESADPIEAMWRRAFEAREEEKRAVSGGEE
jgi:DNA-binding MarR family transcriptional regulator